MQSQKQIKSEEKMIQEVQICQNDSQQTLVINGCEYENLYKEFSIKQYICRGEQVLQYQSKIIINFRQKQEVGYYYDGQLIKIEKIQEGQQKFELPYNLEQIRYLNWIGEYGMNKRKTGKWIATWKSQKLDAGGLYCQKGKKQGQWKELIEGYSDQLQVYQVGQYINEIKQGVWKFVQENKDIGGGEYNIDGIKIGQWIELSECFNRDSDVKYIGEYIHGLKVGRWNSIYYENIQNYEDQIGGGTFNDYGLKDGFWVEPSDNFCINSYFIYQGCYRNGIKQGKWEIFLNQLLIGGGQYDVNGTKNWFWIEVGINSSKQNLRSYLQFLISQNKSIYQGNYKNGRKCEIWDIFYDEERIGGGEFDANGQKDGYWVELSDYFQNQNQITFNGQYKNGYKCGNWNIMLRMYKDRPFQEIGGGFFDLNGKKEGSWIDIGIEFSNLKQITYIGEYKDDKKVGKWETTYQKQKIGGGSYDQNEIKNGKWVDLCAYVQPLNLLIYNLFKLLFFR